MSGLKVKYKKGTTLEMHNYYFSLLKGIKKVVLENPGDIEILEQETDGVTESLIVKITYKILT